MKNMMKILYEILNGLLVLASVVYLIIVTSMITWLDYEVTLNHLFIAIICACFYIPGVIDCGRKDN